jgi:WD40-like Beta Propeller Repeat
MRPIWCIFAVVAGACGSKHTPPPPAHDDARVAGVKDAAPPELAPRPLGMATLDGFAWRKRPGQPAFRTARKAEHRGDWAGVVAACEQALAADPGHLEAAWLEAVALARLGKLDAVTGRLAVAGAGDFGKWATASLRQPALQPYLATTEGQAWRRRVEDDRPAYAAALARSIAVIADGDLYAFDPGGPRWYRLTRTYGGVIAAFASPDGRQLAYVSRTRKKAAATPPHVTVGVVDLATGRSHRSIELAPGPFAIAFETAKPTGFWVGQGATAHVLDASGIATATKRHRPHGPFLELTRTGAIRHHRLPVASISADWDDQSLASAIRIATSNRVVTVPSPGLIDGNTLAWSPDRSHLAFVAQLSDRCTPGTPNGAAFVADAATGTVTELARADNGLAIEWRSDRQLAIAGDDGVALVELGGASPVAIQGATGLVTPRRRARCTPEPASEPSSEPGEPDDDPADPGDVPDAGLPPP